MIQKQTWTVSRLKAWQTCPMKEALRYREGLAPISNRPALRFGSAIHKGLETRDITAALDVLNDGFFPRDQQEADEHDIAEATLIALLDTYFERFPPFAEHQPEKQFDMPLMLDGKRRSRKFRIAGKIDDLIQKDGRDWIVEYKTAGRLDASYFDRLYVDSQITMYIRFSRHRPLSRVRSVSRKSCHRLSGMSSFRKSPFPLFP